MTEMDFDDSIWKNMDKQIAEFKHRYRPAKLKLQSMKYEDILFAGFLVFFVTFPIVMIIYILIFEAN